MIGIDEINAIVSNAIIKEERGVAGRKFNNVVDEVVRYCQDVISPGNGIGAFFKNIFNRGKEYKVRIPKEITEKFDFIENLEINVTFYEMGSSHVSSSGGGIVHYDRGETGSYFTPDKRLYSVRIDLEAFHHNGTVLARTLTNSLYHELNHAYDVWSRGGKGPNFVNDYADDVSNGYSVKNNFVFSPIETVNEFFRDIFYRLFIPTEFNALVSGVYGDLSGMDSERINYKSDVQETQAAWILNGFTRKFDDYLCHASVDSLMEACKIMGIDDVSRQDPHTFLVTFKLSFEKKIREAWKRIGRAASLWYDDKEESKEINEGLYVI